MQIAAVKHIVAGTSYPLPYLLIGFPGKAHVQQKMRMCRSLTSKHQFLSL